jgi:hypothetical protein
MLDNAHISLEEKLRAVPVEGEFRCLISRMLDAQTFSLGLYLVSNSISIRHRVRVDTDYRLPIPSPYGYARYLT